MLSFIARGSGNTHCRLATQRQTQSQARTYASKSPQSKKDTSVRVTLVKTVDRVGEVGEELTVTKGYARNYLFPNDIAVYSTPETREQYAEAAQKIDYEARKRRQNIEKANKTISKVTVKVKRESVFGRPHSPVDRTSISKSLWKQAHIELDPSRIAEDVTAFGTHEVPVILGESQDYNATLRVELSKR